MEKYGNEGPMNEQHIRSIAWAVDQIMEVCTEIGCSGISPDLCRKHPERCSIIRKLMEASDDDISESGDGDD